MKTRMLVKALVTTLVIAGIAAGAAVAGSGGDTKKQVTALKRQVKTLKSQNARLQQYSPAGIAKQLAATKTALDKYQDVNVAKADGYQPASPCTFFPGGNGNASSDQGGMGVHFMNQAYVADGKIIPSKPELLVYQPTANGGYELVAAEYFKPDADQNVKTDGDRPTLFGRAFDGPMLGHSPGMPIHYDLHVWLWKHNADGMFAEWNPDVTCS
jgi:hypothetical protein